MVGFVFQMALVDDDKDGWVVVLFDCWSGFLDALAMR
jgi:hypothetical protein